jgi:hypothetical protein
MHCIPNQLGSRICLRVQATPTNCMQFWQIIAERHLPSQETMCHPDLAERSAHLHGKQLHAYMIINNCQCWSLCMQHHSDYWRTRVCEGCDFAQLQLASIKGGSLTPVQSDPCIVRTCKFVISVHKPETSLHLNPGPITNKTKLTLWFLQHCGYKF